MIDAVMFFHRTETMEDMHQLTKNTNQPVYWYSDKRECRQVTICEKRVPLKETDMIVVGGYFECFDGAIRNLDDPDRVNRLMGDLTPGVSFINEYPFVSVCQVFSGLGQGYLGSFFSYMRWLKYDRDLNRFIAISVKNM